MIHVMSAAHRVGARWAAFLFFEDHIVHVHGMVWHFVGVDKMFSRKGLLYNWEEIAEFSRLFAVVGKIADFS